MSGFVMLMRSDETRELLRDPKAFVLLTQIAYRARWSDSLSVDNLKPGQALIGDHRACGLTEKEYRNAKDRLEKWNLATFQGANKGTVATLSDARVFDIRATPKGGQGGSPQADKGRTEGGQGASNKTEKIGEDGIPEPEEQGSAAPPVSIQPDQTPTPPGPARRGMGADLAADFATIPLPKIEDYGDIRQLCRGPWGPVAAAVAVTGERGKPAWGHWVHVLCEARKVKGCDVANRYFLEAVESTFGEMKAGEVRKPGAILNKKLDDAFGSEICRATAERAA